LMSFWHLEKTCMAHWPAWLAVLCYAVAAVFLLGAESDYLFLKNGVAMKTLDEGDSQSTDTASGNLRDIVHWKCIPVAVRVLLVPINHEQWPWWLGMQYKHFAGICCLHLQGRSVNNKERVGEDVVNAGIHKSASDLVGPVL
jgi:hypothetical protein